MSKQTSNSEQAGFVPPVSTFTGPIAELVAHGMLSPPSRPGLLATLDRYEILRIIGSGGMGLVLLGRDSVLDQNVAIKMVKPELVSDRQVTHLFVKEAGHMQKLRHSSIMAVQEVSDRAEGPYFVMPYFEKGSLARRITPGEPLGEELIFDIAMQIADGLQFAHRRGIIHRDLKPANILLSANGKACLSDFGLARTMFNDTIVDVERDQCEGTAPYMSPAVAAGNAEDTRCDIYAFGAVLYEMLTGEAPYKGENSKAIRAQIVAKPPRPILDQNPEANRGLVTVAESAMGRELRERYADMADVLADLHRVKDGKPAAGPHGIAGKMRGQLVRVSQVSALTWLAVGVALFALTGWLLWRNSPGPRPNVQNHPQPQPGNDVPVKPLPATNIVPPVVANTNLPVLVKTNTPAPVDVPKPVTTTTVVSTFAGMAGAKGSVDGKGSSARFDVPSSVAVDGAGNVYVADTASHVIRQISPDGTVSTLAGLAGSSGSIDDDGSDARFLAPFGVAADDAGNVYVADTFNNTIRKIAPNSSVTTLAGLAKHAGKADGVGDNARFRNPWSVAVDKAGNVYVADSSNDTIRKINPDGKVTTLAGQFGAHGSSDGFGSGARFWNPQGVAVDATGNIYVSDTGNNTIRKISPTGMVTTLAGTVGVKGSADGTSTRAQFSGPQGLSVDKTGNIYVADTDNSAIRKITPTGVVSTLAGRPNSPAGFADGTFAIARFSHPNSVAVDRDGNIYVADTDNHIVRKGTP